MTSKNFKVKNEIIERDLPAIENDKLYNKTDFNFVQKNVYKINNYEFNKKEFKRTMNEFLHIKTK